MNFQRGYDLDSLAEKLPYFLDLVGRERWFRRADHLDREQQASPFRHKIVADYHWLEMVISYQAEVLAHEGRLLPKLVDASVLAGLRFAAIVVDVHTRLAESGRRVLEGRLRDAFNAETGFAALFLELDIAERMMASGLDVTFSDMEGRAAFDLEFNRGDVCGEVECKSISVDAGRAIHRKDFYRFVESVVPPFEDLRKIQQGDVLTIRLNDRLPSNTDEQRPLRDAVMHMLHDPTHSLIEGPNYRLERQALSYLLGDRIGISDDISELCRSVFGRTAHVAGGLTESGGCLIVMRSEREDDTSKPLLASMRKAASQLSATKPSFIAVQFQDIEPADLMSPNLRRRAGLLSHALFNQYGANHINACYFCGFGAIVARTNSVGTPGFTIPNPKPLFPISEGDASPFMSSLSDEDYAAAIGAPLPAPNISYIAFEPSP